MVIFLVPALPVVVFTFIFIAIVEAIGLKTRYTILALSAVALLLLGTSLLAVVGANDVLASLGLTVAIILSIVVWLQGLRVARKAHASGWTWALMVPGLVALLSALAFRLGLADVAPLDVRTLLALLVATLIPVATFAYGLLGPDEPKLRGSM